MNPLYHPYHTGRLHPSLPTWYKYTHIHNPIPLNRNSYNSNPRTPRSPSSLSHPCSDPTCVTKSLIHVVTTNSFSPTVMGSSVLALISSSDSFLGTYGDRLFLWDFLCFYSMCVYCHLVLTPESSTPFSVKVPPVLIITIHVDSLKLFFTSQHPYLLLVDLLFPFPIKKAQTTSFPQSVVVNAKPSLSLCPSPTLCGISSFLPSEPTWD